MSEPSVRGLAHRLNQKQRAMLMRHIDGPVPIVKAEHSGGTINSLTSHGIIRATKRGRPINWATHTMLTDLGREILAVILADTAESLVKLGMIEGPIPTPAEMVERINRVNPRPPARKKRAEAAPPPA